MGKRSDLLSAQEKIWFSLTCLLLTAMLGYLGLRVLKREVIFTAAV